MTDILSRIGNTSLLALRKVVPENGARVMLKLESENPTGSMKDRMALAIVAAASADERLRAGAPVVEYTRRQHGGFARAGVRGDGASAAHRHLGRLRDGEARPHAGAWCIA